MNGPPMQKAHHHELVDAEVIHQADVVVGVGVPRPIDFERPEDWPPLALRRSAPMQRNSPANSAKGSNGIAAAQQLDRRVQPPPAMSIRGKPLPCSS
jgi:hypothetical protein